jgi:hypothetical protein
MDYKKGLSAAIKKEVSKTQNPIVDLVQKLFHSRDVMHLAHLKTTSYAAHVAIGDYYDAILGFADDLLETAQGCEGKLFSLTIPTATVQDPLTHLKEMKECVLGCREKLEYDFQKNMVDEITALIAKTMYKLQFLK